MARISCHWGLSPPQIRGCGRWCQRPGVLSAVISPPWATHQGARDGQAQARSGGRPALVEPIEDVRQIGGCDADAPCPTTAHPEPAALGARLHRHPSVPGCVANRVHHHVRQHFAYPQRIEIHERQVRPRSGPSSPTPFASACADSECTTSPTRTETSVGSRRSVSVPLSEWASVRHRPRSAAPGRAFPPAPAAAAHRHADTRRRAAPRGDPG